MINQLFTVDNGRNKVIESLPRIEKCNTNDFKLLDVQAEKLVIKLRDRKLDITSQEETTFKTITGIDSRMMSQLSPPLQLECWGELIANSDREMTIKIRDGKIVGLLEGHSKVPNYREWIDRILDEVDTHQGIAGVSNITQTSAKVGFGIVTRIAQEPAKRVGDLVSEGVYVSMNGTVTARPYHLRLTCTNGAVATKRGNEIELTDADWRAQLNEALLGAKSFTTAFTSLAANSIENSAGLVASLAYLGAITDHMRDEIARQIEEQGAPRTEYDLINLITSHQHQRPNAMTWLLAGGRAVDALHSGRCRTCHHKLNEAHV